MNGSDSDHLAMQRAFELAARGIGAVEPNPMVGCVIVRDGQVVGEGWHRQCGGPHAEVEALRQAGEQARGATLYVTLEPCCHFGRTPPCTQAILSAGIRRVLASEPDPFPLVNGGGIAQLREAGVEVRVGLLADRVHELNAPFHKLVTRGWPWMIAKWAMSLDGKLATRTSDSKWISNDRSRAVVHQLRGRVDAILVGRRTVEADDPQLTARPSGPRTAVRIVLDSQGCLSSESQLVRTAQKTPVLVVTGEGIDPRREEGLRARGCDLLKVSGSLWSQRWPLILDELGRRKLTNVLVEGGGTTLGGLFDLQLVDEVHAFVGPRIIGGERAPGPVGGIGIDQLHCSLTFASSHWENLDGDLYFRGRLARPCTRSPDST